MEPGRQRENPPGSGEAESGEWREETTGVEAAERDATLKNRSGDGGNEAMKKTPENSETVTLVKEKDEYEEDEEQYEEELDPRIQVLKSGFKINMKI